MSEFLWTSKLVGEILGIEIPGNWQSPGVSWDSRDVSDGKMFFAVQIDSFDAHNFAHDAIDKGSPCVFVSRPVEGIDPKKFVIVEDVSRALQKLAIYYRNLMSKKTKVICVIGSSGKTTTHEMIVLALSNFGKLHTNRRNFNGRSGVPRELILCPLDADYCVMEAGISRPGEMDEIGMIVKPDILLIVNVTCVHIEHFENENEIIFEKAKMIKYMSKGGIVVLGGDNSGYDNGNDVYSKLFTYARELGHEVITFGKSPKSDVRIKNYIESQHGTNVQLDLHDQETSYEIGMIGEHFIYNSVAAFTVCNLVGLDNGDFAKRIMFFKQPKGRGQITKCVLPNGTNVIVLDDTYNSNIHALALSVDSVRRMKHKGGKIAIIAPMGETGSTKVEVHNRVPEYLVGLFDMVISIGEDMKEAHESLPDNMKLAYLREDETLEAISIITQVAKDGDLVFLKGSRKFRLERIVDKLKQGMSETPA